MRKSLVVGFQLVGAAAFAALCIALAFSHVDLARLWPVWFTVSLFGAVVWETRRLWRRRLYWAVLLGALALHLLLLFTIERSHLSAPLIAYVILGTAEAAAVLVILTFLKGR